MRRCSVCAHKNRKEIDRELIQGIPYRKVAKKFGFANSTLQYHQRAGHIPACIAKAEEAKQIAKGADLLKWTRGLLGKSISYMDQAEATGDLRTAISAVREARGCVEAAGPGYRGTQCQEPDFRPGECRRPDYYDVPGVAGSHACFIQTPGNPC